VELLPLDTDLTRRAARVVDAYVKQFAKDDFEGFQNVNADGIVDQWRRAIHVFNDNHGYLSFFGTRAPKG